MRFGTLNNNVRLVMDSRRTEVNLYRREQYHAPSLSRAFPPLFLNSYILSRHRNCRESGLR